ncbi:MAG: chromosomal replication initiator protein DnaA [Proteobacteria bacterium]|nr:chromosomal replication initiator protein DnaA [Pseudomonadota bacterium]
MEQLWRQICPQIREAIGEDEFQVWVRPLRVDPFVSSRLVLVAPNKFFRDWVQEKYSSLIQEALQGIDNATNFKLVVSPQPPLPRSGRAVLPTTDAPAEARIYRTNLNIRHTFDNFVVGKYNQFSHAASQAVAHEPAQHYNPLFIYGGTGLGKTHLINAIGNHIVEHSGLTVYYVSSEVFTNELISAIRFKSLNEFREKYRYVDTLLVDDIQFIAGREAIQEEFFHTFNTLYESRRQIVMTSDMFPKEIPGLEDRLRSRFEWGLIADMSIPDDETKVAILQKKAEEEHIPLPKDVAFFLASHSGSNIRALEGYLVRLSAYASFTGRTFNLELAQDVLKDLVRVPLVSLDSVQKEVSDYFRVTIKGLCSPKKSQAIAWPRQVAMYLCRKLTNASLKEIGQAFGGKDHSTVVHAVNKIRSCLESGDSRSGEILTLDQRLTKQSSRG